MSLAQFPFSVGPFAQGPLSGSPISAVTPEQWSLLYDQVEGRLTTTQPWAAPCFSEVDGIQQTVNSSACEFVKENYLDGVVRAASLGALSNTQWEGCQATGEQCILDWTNPSNDKATAVPYRCEYGSISRAYVDVEKPEDVQYAFSFAKALDLPIAIRNTGHDYKGRSSAPESLGISVNKLKALMFHPDFVADGCSGEGAIAITSGGGVLWKEVYAFADAHNVTIVGGTDASVGASGGWLQGGGHSALSINYGMGADNALQFKIVTPTGEYLTANACQNQDLFWALRGGGGGTFGVVMEATQKVQPVLNLQVTLLSWASNTTQPDAYTRDLWSIALDNAVQWAEKGYGGYIYKSMLLYLTPKLDANAAKEAMAPVLSFGDKLAKENVPQAFVKQFEFPKWHDLFAAFLAPHPAETGAPQTVASRLIPRDNFASAASRETLLNALLEAYSTAPGGFILATPPASFAHEEGATSVHPAWRTSLYHTVVTADFNFNSTLAEKKEKYDTVSRAIAPLRAITPDAAYVSEADVHEPNWQKAFWGSNYEKLLEIKKTYDPDHILDCWHCVGWEENSPRYACYI